MRARGLLLIALLAVGVLGPAFSYGAQARLAPDGPMSAAALETWHSFRPVGWVTGTPVTCSIQVAHSTSLLPLAQYRISTNGGASWSDPWQDCSPGPQIIGTTAVLTATNVAFPHSATESQNYIQFRIVDGFGIQLVSDPAMVRVDTLPPSSTITTSGCYTASWPGHIMGTASDSGSGIQVVEISLRRSSDSQYYNGASWQPSPIWLAATGTSNWSYSFAPGTHTYTVQSRARDVAGLSQAAYGQSTFSHDSTPPESAVLTTGGFSASTWPGVIVGTASDVASGVASVEVRIQRQVDGLYFNGAAWVSGVTWIPATGSSAWSVPFMPSLDTRYDVASRAIDNCGNTSSPSPVMSFTYDNSAPGSPVNPLFSPQGWSQANSFAVSWANPPDPSGIEAVHFKWNAPPTGNDDESPGSPRVGFDIRSMSGLQVPSQGIHQLYLWLEDATGNADYRTAIGIGPFSWDSVPPNTSVVSLTGTHGCGTWFTTGVQANVSAMDVTSGISATYWRVDSGAWQQLEGNMFEVIIEGNHTVDYYSVDVAGNAEPVRTVSPPINIDFTPPTTAQPRYTGTLSPSGWYTSTVAVSLIALDATSGVSATFYQLNEAAFVLGNTFTVSMDGVYGIRYYSMDAACNSEPVQTATALLRVDRTPPMTSHQLDGKTGQAGWFVGSPVTVTLSSSDEVLGVSETSGLDRIRYRIDGGTWQQSAGPVVSFVVSMPQGQSEYVRQVEYYATDLAGNAEPVRVVSVGMDYLAPGPILHVPSVSPSGWANTDCFLIAWDRTDNPNDVSGIGGVYYSFTVPVSPTDGTLVEGDNITSLTCVSVPEQYGDGARNVYLWLKDKAGNSDHRNRVTVSVRLDRTPPQVTTLVNGRLCDTAGWYNSAVTVTFVATDLPSGMVGGVISYHVAGGDGWTPGNAYLESRDGRYTVEGRAADAAGNVSSVVTATFKVDRTAPQAPIAIQVQPSGWSSEDCFNLSWLNPTDLAGIAGAYYKRGNAPTSPTDGTYIEGASASLACVSAEVEGEVPFYVWLADKACNVDHTRRAMVLLRYDLTPPTTTFATVGTMGGDGWYRSDVTVNLTGSDGGSGWATSQYRVGGGAWREGTSFSVSAQGVITFSYYSIDVAGNAEAPQMGSVKIDAVPPSSSVSTDSYSPTPSFTVYWNGSDEASGIASFDVQYRVGSSGTWQDWITNVDSSQRSRLFTLGVAGKTFYFRCRARDRAGNLEPYPDVPDAYVSVDLLTNGDFGRELSTGWERSWDGQPGGCVPTRAAAPSYAGVSTWVAVLGCPDQREPAPLGVSMLCQTLNVPTRQDMSRPSLNFRYRIFTYDVLWGPTTNLFYDSLHVGVWPQGHIAPTWVFTDGNMTGSYGELLDLGWREGSVDLEQYAGQTIWICLSTVTREDPTLNTWAFVDDIRLVNLERRLYLPMIRGNRSQAGLSAQAHQGSLTGDQSVVR